MTFPKTESILGGHMNASYPLGRRVISYTKDLVKPNFFLGFLHSLDQIDRCMCSQFGSAEGEKNGWLTNSSQQFTAKANVYIHFIDFLLELRRSFILQCIAGFFQL